MFPIVWSQVVIEYVDEAISSNTWQKSHEISSHRDCFLVVK